MNYENDAAQTDPYATVAGTARYRARFAHLPAAHFRLRYGLWLGSIGLGTYLEPGGLQADETGLRGYVPAVQQALELGCNVLDTASNYRGGRSEAEVGRALRAAIDAGRVARDEVLVCTKGGYLTRGALGRGRGDRSGQDGVALPDQTALPLQLAQGSALRDETPLDDAPPDEVLSDEALRDEIVGGNHCIAPRFLAQQIGQSLENLGLETIDVYYLHNPETQLRHVAPAEFKARLRRAFEHLESEAATGRIRLYGVATWDGLQADPQDRAYLPLTLLEQIAREVGGDKHRFRFVQFPYNVLRRTAFSGRNQPLPPQATQDDGGNDGEVESEEGGEDAPQFGPLLAAAMQLGLTAVTSATLGSATQGSATQGQQRALERIPAQLARGLGEWETRAQAAIQFNRSTPGVTTTLVGMGNVAHVEENLAVAQRAPLAREQFFELFQRPAT